MTSIIKVNNIQSSASNAAATIASNGAVTFPQSATFSGGATFNQVPVGAGSMIKILDETISSTGMYILGSTYINSTYNSYMIQIETVPNVDSNYFYSDAYVGGSVVNSGNVYSRYVREIGSGDVWNSPGQDEMVLYNRNALGSAANEGITVNALLQNVNSTTRSACINGMSSYWDDGGELKIANFGGGFKAANASSVVNGINFYYGNGSTTFTGTIKLYGVL